MTDDPGPRTLLCADDDAEIRDLVASVLREAGFRVTTARDGHEAIELFEADVPDLAIVDLRMPRVDGMTALRRMKALAADVPVILVTGYGDVKIAVEAMKCGAYELVTKPFDFPDLVARVTQALERRAGLGPRARTGDRAATDASLTELMGESDAVGTVARSVMQVACTNLSVLISGETGTGKEIVARAIHRESSRCDEPLVAIDCGAIPETLTESELFGYEKGAFTGAERRKQGYFALADGGTLFLDEVTNLPLSTQAKLLRALQERTIHPLGATSPVAVDVRVIAASNVSLEAAVRTGRFREDLYYRLSEFTITLPPLRERRQDITHLARRFLREAARELERPIRGFSPEAIRAMIHYDWPGNVRELRNVVRQAVLVGSPILAPEHLGIVPPPPPPLVAVPAAPAPADAAPADAAPRHTVRSLRAIGESALIEAERLAIGNALARAHGNKSEAARILATDYKTLHLKMKRYGIRAEPVLM